MNLKTKSKQKLEPDLPKLIYTGGKINPPPSTEIRQPKERDFSELKIVSSSKDIVLKSAYRQEDVEIGPVVKLEAEAPEQEEVWASPKKMTLIKDTRKQRPQTAKPKTTQNLAEEIPQPKKSSIKPKKSQRLSMLSSKPKAKPFELTKPPKVVKKKSKPKVDNIPMQTGSSDNELAANELSQLKKAYDDPVWKERIVMQLLTDHSGDELTMDEIREFQQKAYEAGNMSLRFAAEFIETLRSSYSPSSLSEEDVAIPIDHIMEYLKKTRKSMHTQERVALIQFIENMKQKLADCDPNRIPLQLLENTLQQQYATVELYKAIVEEFVTSISSALYTERFMQPSVNARTLEVKIVAQAVKTYKDRLVTQMNSKARAIEKVTYQIQYVNSGLTPSQTIKIASRPESVPDMDAAIQELQKTIGPYPKLLKEEKPKIIITEQSAYSQQEADASHKVKTMEQSADFERESEDNELYPNENDPFDPYKSISCKLKRDEITSVAESSPTPPPQELSINWQEIVDQAASPLPKYEAPKPRKPEYPSLDFLHTQVRQTVVDLRQEEQASQSATHLARYTEEVHENTKFQPWLKEEPEKDPNLAIETYHGILDDLRQRERQLLNLKRQVVYEQHRPPVKKWYELRSAQFSNEHQRSIVYLDPNANKRLLSKLGVTDLY